MVADKRPRFKGRFVSEEKAAILYREYEIELALKERAERFFITKKVEKSTGLILSIKAPSQETIDKRGKKWVANEKLHPEFKFRISSELGWAETKAI